MIWDVLILIWWMGLRMTREGGGGKSLHDDGFEDLAGRSA
jgi:hypothetical protein